MTKTVSGQLIDIRNRRIFPGRITFDKGRIEEIEETPEAPSVFILPGFIDAHVHIESSLLPPSEFARMAVVQGTVATVSDPHEIANVLGVGGIRFMMENGRQVPFWFNFGAPSCVPATLFETAGASLDAEEVKLLLAEPEIRYLSEMMNFPGVINRDEEVLKKIAAAHKEDKPVDGHAPGLRGEELRNYVAAGISTDHECFTLEEAEEKISFGMKVLIREGSAARNFDALIPLMSQHANSLMFCSDDLHPDLLETGHVNRLVARAVALDYNVFDVLQAACLNPHQHYGLSHGLLNVGDSADFIVVEDLKGFKVLSTFVKGECVAHDGKCMFESVPVTPVNRFHSYRVNEEQMKKVPAETEPVMVCLDGQLITLRADIPGKDVDLQNDCLKLVVVNRYAEAAPAVCYVRNFGLKKGAIAGSVAHDSHNILAVGVNDQELVKAINSVMENKGALVAINGSEYKVLPLPIAGLMGLGDAWDIASQYRELDRYSKDVLGSTLKAPFMSLSFMALLVIPELKLSDRGLFDGRQFAFVPQT